MMGYLQPSHTKDIVRCSLSHNKARTETSPASVRQVEVH